MLKHSAIKLLSVLLLAGLFLLSGCESSGDKRLGEVNAYKRVAASGVDFTALWDAAHEYNERLAQMTVSERLFSEENLAPQIKLPNTDLMGVIEIPVIDVNRPFYHASDNAVALGMYVHLVGTSLPTGSAGTHCALTLGNSREPVDLDRLQCGDPFILRVMDSVQTYEIDQYVIVLPDQMEALEISEGESYCSLITSVPYGVNSHRLIIRGRLIGITQAEDLPEEEVSRR